MSNITNYKRGKRSKKLRPSEVIYKKYTDKKEKMDRKKKHNKTVKDILDKESELRKLYIDNKKNPKKTIKYLR